MAEEVHVITSGPSGAKFFQTEVLDKPGSGLVIAVNDAAYDVCRLRVSTYVPVIHFTADYPYAKIRPVAMGALGLWLRPRDDHPIPSLTEFPMWIGTSPLAWPTYLDGVMRVGSSTPACGGYSAWNLADQLAWSHVHLWGFDGGGRYEKFRECLEQARMFAEVPYTDHAGRL